jgi:hypothetical protein
MFKKILLAGAVVFAGAMFTSSSAEAHGPYGPRGPVYRSGRPVVVVPPYVRSYRPPVNYGYGFDRGYRNPWAPSPWGPPVYRSYRAPVDPFGYPIYGPGFGRPLGPSIYFGF